MVISERSDYTDENFAKFSSNVRANIKSIEKLADSHVEKHKDKSDRATVEQVLDPRTRMVLFKWLNRGIITEINGCVSTGKEANVYQAVGADGKPLAVKIYKTSILVFKDRDRYVTGEYRFRHGYSKSNPRKMVKVWAEKEFRNLGRLQAADIPSPKPLVLKSHTLLMTFIGKSNGRAASRLKDASITDPSELRQVYFDLVATVWKLYNRCRLVHADLSEYNLLYYKKRLYTIDVSQSVEHSHPHALEFLRKDCYNVLSFFRKHNSFATFTLKELYDVVMSNTKALVKRALCMSGLADEQARELLKQVASIFGAGLAAKLRSPAHDIEASFEQQDQLLQLFLEYFHDYSISERPCNHISSEAALEEQVFLNSFIPRNMDEVINVEREAFCFSNNEMALPPSVAVLTDTDELASRTRRLDLGGESDTETISGDSSSCESSDSSREWTEEKPTKSTRSLKRNEDREEKKLRKKAMKESKKEKRANKIPKAVKKRKEKLGREKKV